MSNTLPRIDHPITTIEIPSTKEQRQFRPYTVREEKILLMAKESHNLAEMMAAILQVINSCDIKGGLTNLAIFDVEYIFIKLRAISVSNISTQYYHDNDDNKDYKFDIDIDDIKMVYPEGHSNKISLNEEMGIVLKYPTFDKNLYNDSDKIEQLTLVIKNCLDKLWNGEEIYEFDTYSDTEINAWIDDLPPTFYTEFRKFISTVPHMEYIINFTNSKGTKRNITLNTLSDFFLLQ